MAISIADVASRANVSISTVSRVVNGHNVVNAETRKRVEEAISELGYRPNVFARGLMLNKSNILALVLPDLHGEFYSEIIRGANLRAREFGYQLLISSFSRDETEQAFLGTMGGTTLADGIAVMHADLNDDICDALGRINIPLVVLDGEADKSTFDSVIIDHREGATALMHHLLSSSDIDRITFVGGPTTNLDSNERLDVYRMAMNSAGREVRDIDVYYLDFQYESAHDLATSKMGEWIGMGHCIFAANDEMAAGIVHAALSMGVSVPGDLRVVGFDDTRVSQLLKPRLTTVHVPMSNMGAAAVELLCQRLNDPNRPRTKITLQSQLVIRESCGVPMATSPGMAEDASCLSDDSANH